MNFQAYCGRFREFGTIPRTWPNAPSSKPWAIAQAFCSKLVDFGPFGIQSKSSWTSPKVVGNQFPSILGAFQWVWNDSRHLTKSAIFKTMGYSPGFLLKISRFRAIRNSQEIFMNEPESSWRSISSILGRFREFGTIPGTWTNPPSSKPWAIAQTFCSKLVDFGPFGIQSKSSWMSPKVVGNQFPSILGAFQGVWNDSQDLTKSAIFKTMGYSPGFLLKIGRFRAIRNSQ